MQKVLITIGIQIGMSFLKSLAKELWNDFWNTLLDAVRDVEKQFAGQLGQIKKAVVVAKIMAFIQSKKKMNGVQVWAMNILLNRVIDMIIDQLNTNIGQDWGEKVTDLKQYLASKIPFLK
jgi:hypothetical protein